MATGHRNFDDPIKKLVASVADNSGSYINKPINRTNAIMTTFYEQLSKMSSSEHERIKTNVKREIIIQIVKKIRELPNDKRFLVKLAFSNVFHTDLPLLQEFETIYQEHTHHHGTREMFEIVDSMHHRLSALEANLKPTEGDTRGI